MTVLLALAAQCLHAVLVLLAAPCAIGALNWVEARLCGRDGLSWRAPWRDLRRLGRKETVQAESVPPLLLAAPLAAFAAVMTAALLVPSFALGMSFTGLADLLVIAGLLALARLVLALAALAEGSASGIVAIRQALTFTGGAEVALLLVLLGLGLAAGTTNVDLLAELQQAHMLQPYAAVVLMGGSLALLATAQHEAGMPETACFAGPTLALLRMTEALRLLVWIDLIGVVFLPFGIGSAQDFPAGWAVGFMGWAVRLALAVGLLAGIRVAGFRLVWRRVPGMLAAAVLLAFLAGLLVLTQARPV